MIYAVCSKCNNVHKVIEEKNLYRLRTKRSVPPYMLCNGGKRVFDFTPLYSEVVR